jgi:hypothetical protein
MEAGLDMSRKIDILHKVENTVGRFASGYIHKGIFFPGQEFPYYKK